MLQYLKEIRSGNLYLTVSGPPSIMSDATIRTYSGKRQHEDEVERDRVEEAESVDEEICPECGGRLSIDRSSITVAATAGR